MIDNKTTCRAIGFLVWFRKFYKNKTTDTYLKIAENYGQCNHVTVRTYMLELEESGYVKIENRGKRPQTFIINEEKYIEAVR